MTKDPDVAMKKPHRHLFLLEWKKRVQAAGSWVDWLKKVAEKYKRYMATTWPRAKKQAAVFHEFLMKSLVYFLKKVAEKEKSYMVTHVSGFFRR